MLRVVITVSRAGEWYRVEDDGGLAAFTETSCRWLVRDLVARRATYYQDAGYEVEIGGCAAPPGCLY